jgi:hypothetical protein
VKKEAGNRQAACEWIDKLRSIPWKGSVIQILNRYIESHAVESLERSSCKDQLRAYLEGVQLCLQYK